MVVAVVVFQMRAVPSWSMVRHKLSSELNLIFLTLHSSPLKVCIRLPVWVFQTRAVPSRWVVSISLLFGLKVLFSMEPLLKMCLLRSVLQICTPSS